VSELKDLTVEDARGRMLAEAVRMGAETVSLDAAVGRVLAEAVTAQRHQPPFDASAMDGWAVSGAGERFAIMGESAAGHGYGARLEPGQAVRIFTGAPVPEGADRIVIQEEATRDGDRVLVAAIPDAGSFIRPRGGDFRSGEVLLEAGQRIDPWRMSLAAAAGRASLLASRRPEVVLLSTGEEIVPAGTAPGPDQIFDSGTPALSALVEAWGGRARRLAATGDDLEAIAAAVRGAGGDLVVTVGGASVGDHDLVKPALARLGLELKVETVRLRPGKPTWFGRLADGRRVLGLPGNPASALVCAELFLKPLLMAMQGADPALPMASARLASPLPANGPREHWARAELSARDGGLWVRPMTDQDSSLVSVFARAGALVRCPRGMPAAEVGTVVDVLLLDRL
jgi:molybdopterin molybdotransferase